VGVGRALARIGAYYALLGAAVAALFASVPWLMEALLLGRVAEVGLVGDVGRTLGGGSEISSTSLPTGSGALAIAALSLVGSLLIMIPVAWTYTLIRRRSGYDESVVHTLLILPIAVTGIVLIVKGSLALAFSLAGIVAAVRFRTTLEDTKDAVYVFLAIGVGLAAGVQALGVAIALSVVFNVVNLALSRMNFGNVYADRLRRTGGLSLGDAVAGAESASSAVAFGDARVLNALSPTELKEVADRLGRTDRYLSAEADTRKERKHYSVLMVYTSEVGATQERVEPLLERMAMRWSLAEIAHADAQTSVVEYLVRLPEGASAGDLLDAIRTQAGDVVRAAEIRSLRGLARKT
jgi:hypothetical protein